MNRNSLLATLSVAVLRAKLLIRQRLGLFTLIAGIAFVLLSVSISHFSFVNKTKIFWDFSLGLVFVCQVALALYFGSQLFAEERGRRTLHLLLSSGLSRWQWLISNVVGIAVVLWAMNLIWYLVILGISHVTYESDAGPIAAQAMVLLSIETLILILIAMLFALMIRPLLALIASAVLVFGLHSLSAIQRIFADPQTTQYVQDTGQGVFLQIARFLPPLEWLDLKPLVGYQDALPASTFLGLAAAGLAWAALLAALCWLRFERMDL